ncbi:LysM peptidoglycan-binding domain-containing protein [Chlamydiifrater phoenicopteri]|uniref:LysM peptidoglycan-binding domain-containing protein n=1 Tax=Chlamydiifrater phoenicopteri TaxID=2681469 RepID=UPI001BCE1BB8|nr:LysM peptidoglycan-binding domain-containing protein [Chlamydiifrater phoenicopteri]
MWVNNILKTIMVCLVIGSLESAFAKEQKKIPISQLLEAELEELELKFSHHEAELALLSDRLDEMETKISSALLKDKNALQPKIASLESEQKKIKTSLTALASSLKETQTCLYEKLKALGENHELLLKDMKLLRRSLASLIDGSQPGEYPEIICESSKKFYTVQKGDSLWTISKKFQISPKELKKINKLNSDDIYAGQRLCLTSEKKDK